MTSGATALFAARWTASAVPHAPAPRTATAALIDAQAPALQPEDLAQPYEARHAVAMTHLDPAGRSSRGRRSCGLRQFEQDVLFRTEHHRSGVIRLAADLGNRCT